MGLSTTAQVRYLDVDVEIEDDEILDYLRNLNPDSRSKFEIAFTGDPCRADFFKDLKLIAHRNDALAFMQRIEKEAAECGVLMDLRTLGLKLDCAA